MHYAFSPLFAFLDYYTRPDMRGATDGPRQAAFEEEIEK
jgi:hypothetical protein